MATFCRYMPARGGEVSLMDLWQDCPAGHIGRKTLRRRGSPVPRSTQMMRQALTRLLAVLVLCTPAACMQTADQPETASAALLPAMRWDHRPEAMGWTAATLAALRREGAVLETTVPSDIAAFCPAYASAPAADRRAFWAGFLSALAKHESTWNPRAKGGGGKWIGLMQIAPQTAAANGCEASSGKSLTDGAANLACAVKIAARQVGRDGAIVSDGAGDWRGAARDWAPLRSAEKRADVASWTRAQSYCN